MRGRDGLMADLHVHTLTVRRHHITCDSPVLVQHGMGHDAVALDLDAEWDGLSARLVLGPCGSAYDVLYEDAPVVVPAATLAEAGWLPVSVVGYGEDGTVRVTTERCDHLLRVVESGCVDGSVPPEDAPDLLRRIDVLYARGKLTEEESAELIEMARDNADAADSYDPLEERVSALERWQVEAKDAIAELQGDTEPAEEWPEYKAPQNAEEVYRNGDKVTFQGDHYICTAPEGKPCPWSPTEHPAYWEKQD